MTKNESCDLNHLEKQIGELVALCERKDSAGIRRKLQAIIPEYAPHLTKHGESTTDLSPRGAKSPN
jgi:hypothetical protein